jgi:hypothetical protein
VIADGEYGVAVVANVAASSSMGNVSGSEEPEGITTNNTVDASEEIAVEEPAASEEPVVEEAAASDAPERPADLGPDDEPPGGFGGID